MAARMLLALSSVLLSAAGTSSYITCYQCSTTYDPQSTIALQCNDTFQPQGISTCAGLVCTKYLFNCTGTADECKRLYSATPGTTVMRGCSNNTEPKDQCIGNVRTGGKAIQVDCVCTSSDCNGVFLDNCARACRPSNSSDGASCTQACSAGGNGSTTLSGGMTTLSIVVTTVSFGMAALSTGVTTISSGKTIVGFLTVMAVIHSLANHHSL